MRSQRQTANATTTKIRHRFNVVPPNSYPPGSEIIAPGSADANGSDTACRAVRLGTHAVCMVLATSNGTVALIAAGAALPGGVLGAVAGGLSDYFLEKRREKARAAIQWMIDPVADGGLGLDPATVAEVTGHDDGGYLISTVYTKLGQRCALSCAQRAVAAYQQRQDAGHAETPPLQISTAA